MLGRLLLVEAEGDVGIDDTLDERRVDLLAVTLLLNKSQEGGRETGLEGGEELVLPDDKCKLNVSWGRAKLK